MAFMTNYFILTMMPLFYFGLVMLCNYTPMTITQQVGLDMGLTLTQSIVFNVLKIIRSRGKSNYSFDT